MSADAAPICRLPYSGRPLLVTHAHSTRTLETAIGAVFDPNACKKDTGHFVRGSQRWSKLQTPRLLLAEWRLNAEDWNRAFV